MRTEKEKMIAGDLYVAKDRELQQDFMRCRQLMRLFNQSTEEQIPYRMGLFRELVGSMGENGYVEPTFKCDYGYNIFIGHDFYANFDCVILDVTPVKIGNNVMFGPRVSVFTAAHPVEPEARVSGLEYGKDVIIGNNVWVGGQTVINPGVTIGDNCVIGSGSVVTKDVPDNSIAAGNPCRVIRQVTDEDRLYWKQRQQAYWDEIKTNI